MSNRIANKALWTGLLIVGAVCGGYVWYVTTHGYTAEKVERDLCKGKWLVYQESAGFTSPLRCIGYPKNKPLPEHFKRYQVKPDLMFSLSDIDELCSPGTGPHDVEGKLICVKY